MSAQIPMHLWTKPGKTKRDRESGQIQRNADNKRKRADWCNQETGTKEASNANFPYETCNGKRYRKFR